MRKLNETIRQDLPGRFSELDFFRRNFSRIVNIYEGNIMPPYEVLIHPCSYCNLSCKWCIGSYVTRDINKDKLLETKLNQVSNMKKIIEGILNYKKEGKDYISEKTSSFKVENVSFSGITGEPMISKDAISYAIKELKKSGIRVGMFTNGVLITPDIQKEILKMDYVLISIDAGNAKTYTRLKCNGKENGTFEKVLNNIESLSKQKEKNNSQLDINIGYIINQYNYEQVYELAKILKKIGKIDRKTFYREHEGNKKSPFYYNTSKYYDDCQTLINKIHEAGGLAFLAHGLIYSFDDNRYYIEKILKTTDIDGLECIYPLFSYNDRKFMITLCKKYKKFMSGGSDYHANNKPTTSMGTGINNNILVEKKLVKDWINYVKKI